MGYLVFGEQVISVPYQNSTEVLPELQYVRRLAKHMPADEMAMCRESEAALNDFCYDWQTYWAEWQAPPVMFGTSGENKCYIDPTTKEMQCSMTNRCSGGHVYENDLSFLSYPCGASCRGSLLIDCCTKCNMYRDSPKTLGVNGVDCAGCEPFQLAKAANEADCTFNGIKFQCKSVDRCHLGQPSAFKKRCNVIPCDRCGSEELRGKCCQECVHRQCTAKAASNSKLVCKGCARAPSSSSSSPTWGLVVVVLTCAIPLSVVVWCIFSRFGRRKNVYGSDSEGSEPEDIPEGQSSPAYTAE